MAGKSNTKYARNISIKDGLELDGYLNQVFRREGTIYAQNEADLLEKLNEQE